MQKITILQPAIKAFLPKLLSATAGAIKGSVIEISNIYLGWQLNAILSNDTFMYKNIYETIQLLKNRKFNGVNVKMFEFFVEKNIYS